VNDPEGKIIQHCSERTLCRPAIKCMANKNRPTGGGSPVGHVGYGMNSRVQQHWCRELTPTTPPTVRGHGATSIMSDAVPPIRPRCSFPPVDRSPAYRCRRPPARHGKLSPGSCRAAQSTRNESRRSPSACRSTWCRGIGVRVVNCTGFCSLKRPPLCGEMALAVVRVGPATLIYKGALADQSPNRHSNTRIINSTLEEQHRHRQYWRRGEMPAARKRVPINCSRP
jgi:hypothetical protein